MYMTPGAADQLGATMLVQGVIGALYWRERTGEGQMVEASLLGALVHMLAIPLNTYLMSGRLPKRPTRGEIFNPLVGWYQCTDGKWIMFSINRPQEAWHDFCRVLDLEEDVETSAKFDSTRARAEHCQELISIIDRAISTKPRDEWLDLFRGRDLICAPVNRLEDVADDEQIRANNYIVDFDHQALGSVKTVGFPVAFGKLEPRVRGGAPELGQHTEEVLLEHGYSWDDIQEFRAQSII